VNATEFKVVILILQNCQCLGQFAMCRVAIRVYKEVIELLCELKKRVTTQNLR
jgi:hypothetical protein